MITNCCGVDRFSAGTRMSPMLAMVIPHLKDGAQKKIVKGPAGLRNQVRSQGVRGRVRTASCCRCRPRPIL